MDTQKKDAT